MRVDDVDLEGLAFSCPPIPLALTLFHSSLTHISLSPEWENLMETSHLRLRGLSLSAYGSHLLQEKTSLIMAEQGTDI